MWATRQHIDCVCGNEAEPEDDRELQNCPCSVSDFQALCTWDSDNHFSNTWTYLASSYVVVRPVPPHPWTIAVLAPADRFRATRAKWSGWALWGDKCGQVSYDTLSPPSSSLSFIVHSQLSGHWTFLMLHVALSIGYDNLSKWPPHELV